MRVTRSRTQQDIAELAGLRHVVERGVDVLDRKDAVDDAAQASVGEAGHQVVPERLDGGRLLLGRTGAQHRPENACPPARESAQREFHLLAAAASDDEQSSLGREQVDVEREVRTADELDDHIRTACLADALLHLAWSDRLDAEFRQAPVRFGGAGTRDHPRAHGADLDSGGAHAAVGAVH